MQYPKILQRNNSFSDAVSLDRRLKFSRTHRSSVSTIDRLDLNLSDRSIVFLPFFFFFNVNFNTVTNRKTIKTIYFYFFLSSSLPFSYPFFFLSFRIVEIFKKKNLYTISSKVNQVHFVCLFIYFFFLEGHMLILQNW